MSEKEELKEGLNTYISMLENKKGEKIEEVNFKNDLKYRLMIGIILFLLAYSVIATFSLLVDLIN